MIEDARTVYVAQGAHAIGRHPAAVIGAVLGSCVAACIWDPALGIGGMNHILLPIGAGRPGAAGTPTQRLVDDLVAAGAAPARLRAKVFGGARMIETLPDIGGRNVACLLESLATRGIAIDGLSTGGVLARSVRFWPHSGRVRMRMIDPGAAQDMPARI